MLCVRAALKRALSRAYCSSAIPQRGERDTLGDHMNTTTLPWPFDQRVKPLVTPWAPSHPILCKVERLSPRVNEELVPNVPSSIWVFPAPDEMATTNLELYDMSILWREEYGDVLEGILACIKRRLAHQEQFNSRRTDINQTMPNAEYFEIKVQSALTAKRDTFFNPFEDPSTHHLALTSSILVLTGYPGIGKSLFLTTIFLLRVAAGLPTVFIHSSTHALVFRDGHMGQMGPLSSGLDLSENLPRNAWILVDTSEDLPSLPPVIKRSQLFIVQAASLCEERFKNSTPSGGGIIKCVLKPFTVQDILAARFLHPYCYATEAALVEFFNKFGGSACYAYAEAAEPNRFASGVSMAVNALHESRIYNALHWGIYGLNIPSGYSGVLLSAFPTSDENRSLYEICPPTPYIAALLLDRMATVSMADVRITMFKKTVRALTTGCRAVAGSIFDDLFHSVLCRGGNWALSSLEHPKNVQLDSDAKTIYVETCLSPFQLSVTGDGIVLTTDANPPPFTAIDAPRMLQPSNTNPLLNTYYQPTARKDWSFDSLYLVEPDHAIVFQAAVTPVQSLSVEGIKILRDMGINRVTYFYVTSEYCTEPVKLILPNPTRTTPASRPCSRGCLYCVLGFRDLPYPSLSG